MTRHKASFALWLPDKHYSGSILAAFTFTIPHLLFLFIACTSEALHFNVCPSNRVTIVVLQHTSQINHKINQMFRQPPAAFISE